MDFRDSPNTTYKKTSLAKNGLEDCLASPKDSKQAKSTSQDFSDFHMRDLHKQDSHRHHSCRHDSHKTDSCQKDSRPKVYFKTFGCRTNLYDTQVMRQNLHDFEATLEESEASIVVVNSCTVTNGADSGVRSYVRKIQSQGKKILFAGCGVGTQGKALFSQNLVSGILGHSHKEHINIALKALSQDKEVFYADELGKKHLDSTMIAEFVGKSRAFVKIQEGCDFACSYCVIPLVRGAARSYEIDSVRSQVQSLIDSGISEVVLTGTNVGSYGKDKGTNISTLLKVLFKLDGLKRVRIGSLEPSQIDEEFLELLGEEKFCRHLHIALQHTHDEMLSIMNRTNRFEADARLLEKIASLGYAIGTDFIVAHPGESQAIWQEALANAKSLPLTHIHPFIYSPRDGTKSANLIAQAKYPPIRGDVAKSRLHELQSAIKAKNRAFRESKKAKNASLKILIEKQLGGHYYGLDEFFNKIIIQSTPHTPLQTLSQPQWLAISDYEIKEEHNYAII